MAPATSLPAPTLGIIELSSIAKGLQVCDLMLKKAEVRLLRSGPVGCGKFLILLTGDEADLQEAVEEGRHQADPFLVSWTFIPNLHPQVFAALAGAKNPGRRTDALGIVEARSLAAMIHASDRAVKTTAVHLVELTFDLDLGGKGYFTLAGSLAELEASVATAVALLQAENGYLHSEILARPHARVRDLVHRGLEGPCSSRG